MKFSNLFLIFYLPLIFGYAERKRTEDDSLPKPLSMDLKDFLPVMNEFSTYTIIEPEVRQGKEQRFSRSIVDEEALQDLHLMTLNFQLDGQRIFIDLKNDDNFLPDIHYIHLQDEQQPKRYNSKNFTKTEMKPCHYSGSIRYKPKSKVVLSTCNGNVNGIIFDIDETYFIHAGDARSFNDKHIIFRQSDLLKSQNHNSSETSHMDNAKLHSRKRLKRTPNFDQERFQEPDNANEDSSYVEFVIVVDNAMFNHYEQNVQKIHYLCLDLTHIMNAIYTPLNIFVVLVDVVIWNRNDEIIITADASRTLNDFLIYRTNELLVNYPNDHAHLLTTRRFDGDVVGKAKVETICSTDKSGAVCVDHSNVTALVASTMAHEMGHNFGLDHDESIPGCICPADKCVMSATSSTKMAPMQWSYCSIERLRIALRKNINYCLRNKPRRIFGAPFCGNGIVDMGEECDCGGQEKCECCNPETCKLRAYAECGAGKCCDLETCSLKSAGTMCRAASDECDLPEFCTGMKETCPMDTYKKDLEPCDESLAFCYKGQCKSHRRGCQFLWGEDASSEFESCYRIFNKYKNRSGSCGFDHLTGKYEPCQNGHELCGMLQCQSSASLPVVGSPFHIASIGKSHVRDGRSFAKCNTASLDFGLNNDPGLVGDGAKCGENMMCLKQSCVSLESLWDESKSCPNDCSGNGVCNNQGNCHCDIGFGGAACNSLGPGGSIDSGPATNSESETTFRRFVLIFGVLVLGIILLLLSICFYGYLRVRKMNRTDSNKVLTSGQENVAESLVHSTKEPRTQQFEREYLMTQSSEHLLGNSMPSLHNADMKSDYAIKVIDLTNKNSPATTLKTVPRTLNLSQHSLRRFNENTSKNNTKLASSTIHNIETLKTKSSEQINVHSDRKRNLKITGPQLQSTTNETVSNLVNGQSKSCENFKANKE